MQTQAAGDTPCTAHPSSEGARSTVPEDMVEGEEDDESGHLPHPRRIARQATMMTTVHRRMGRLRSRNSSWSSRGPIKFGMSGSSSSDRDTDEDTEGATSSAQGQSESDTMEQKETRVWSCTVPFRALVMAMIVCALMVSCTGIFGSLAVIASTLWRSTLLSWQKASGVQQDLNLNLTKSAAEWAYTAQLHRSAQLLQRSVMQAPQEAVGQLWSSMQMVRMANPAMAEVSEGFLEVIGRRAVQQINTAQWTGGPRSALENGCLGVYGRPFAVFVGYQNEDHAGALVNCSGFFMFSARGRGGGAAPIMRTWPVNETTGAPIGPAQEAPFWTTRRPWFLTQANVADWSMKTGRSLNANPLWTPAFIDFRLHSLSFAWTMPIAYCGDYSCFEGVVAASSSLDGMDVACTRAWESLRDAARGSEYDFELSRNSSSVFVVFQEAQLPEGSEDDGLLAAQVGVLLGASDDPSTRMVNRSAVDSSGWVTRATSRALLQEFGSWNAPNLREQRFFHFRADASGAVVKCGDAPDDDDACFQVGSESVDIGGGRRLLVVVSLPVRAFRSAMDHTTKQVREEVMNLRSMLDMQASRMDVVSILIFTVVTLLSVVLSYALGTYMTRPLNLLNRKIQRLQKMRFSDYNTKDFHRVTSRSWRIREVADLEDELAHLACAMRVFGKFVPETIVRSIVRGDERASRPYVDKRVVTIMFSDIQDFTSISEQLTQDDLLLVLTSYLTEMTRTIEAFEGTVAEVLGDGILAFWNTPDDVEDHALKACGAALAQRHALEALNVSFNAERLPRLSMRVGLHTGNVLSGNIGSEFKMKFGCLGDAVNLASRLEGLCKLYGVSICCSQATRAALPAGGGGLLFRRLDRVQVKGRRAPTEVHELLGCEEPPAGRPAPDRLQRARVYEQALTAFQEMRFPVACQLLEGLVQDDVAAAHLLQRARQGSLLAGDASATWSGVLHMDEK